MRAAYPTVVADSGRDLPRNSFTGCEGHSLIIIPAKNRHRDCDQLRNAFTSREFLSLHGNFVNINHILSAKATGDTVCVPPIRQEFIRLPAFYPHEKSASDRRGPVRTAAGRVDRRRSEARSRRRSPRSQFGGPPLQIRMSSNAKCAEVVSRRQYLRRSRSCGWAGGTPQTTDKLRGVDAIDIGYQNWPFSGGPLCK
jgi:hypothetical protein